LVVGLPGVGKTALLRRLVDQPWVGESFPGGVHWLTAEAVDKQRNAQVNYVGLAGDTDNVSVFLDRVSRGPRALVVVDDVSDDGQVVPLIREGANYRLVIASRQEGFPAICGLGAGAWGKVFLDVFRPPESRAMLRELIGPGSPADPVLDELAAHVGHLPLALHLVGTLCHKPLFKGLPPDQLLTELDARIAADDVVRDLFRVCFRQIQSNKSATRVLTAALLFDPARIPWGELGAVAGLDGDRLTRALEDVMNLGVLRYAEDPASLTMHPLIHEAGTRARRGSALFRDLRGEFVRRMTDRLLHASSPADIGDLAPHVRRAVDFICKEGLTEGLAAIDELLQRQPTRFPFQVIDLVLVGDTSVALWDKLLQYRTAAAPADPTPTGAVYRLLLGKAYLRVGHILAARDQLEQATREFDATNSPARFRAQAKALYAEVLRAEGRPREAVAQLEAAAASYRAGGGEFRRELAGIHRKLSRALELAGDFSRAHQNLTAALDIHERLRMTNDIAYDRCLLGDLQALCGHLERAEQNLREAARLHGQEAGSDSAYVAYDLNRLAEVLRRQGRAEEAIGLLRQALHTHTRYYGSASSNAALARTRLAEACADAGRLGEAEDYARKALKCHQDIFGPESSQCAYDRVVLSAARRAKAAREPDGPVRQKLLCEARDAAARAVEALGRREKTVHLPRAWAEYGAVLSALGEREDAAANLWRARERYASLGLQHEVDRVDSLLLDDLFVNGSRDWAASAAAYDRFLQDHPDSLFRKLASRIVGWLAADLASRTRRDRAWVLDLCCGTGSIAAELRRQGVPVQLLGVDSAAMTAIAEARCGGGQASGPGFAFRALRGDWVGALGRDGPGGSPDFVTMNLSIFQFAACDRHLLFRSLTRLLKPGAALYLSTASSDFEFPPEAGDGLNSTNPFKELVYRAAERRGLEIGRPLHRAVAPVFPKDDRDSIRHLLWLYGFELADDLPVVRHERTLAEHVAFTRLPVISRKCFGRELPPEFWDALVRDAPPGYADATHGTVLHALYRPVPGRPGALFFVGPDQGGAADTPLRFAAAAVLRDPDGQILLAKRGEAARDFRGSWSLPSAGADPGVLLDESLRRSLRQHLGITALGLKLVSVRVAPRQDADGSRWRIVMCLFEGEAVGTPRLAGRKYDATRRVRPAEIHDSEEFSGAQGDCFASYRDLAAWNVTRSLGEP
jgi:tetratricopeptide (TPR) repeat protein/ADP-ribose pyrophosphatase YjhB (NUDIX family)